MTVMCRFIIDKMPLIFSTPRYFGHIPLLAVPCRTRSSSRATTEGRNDGTPLGYGAFPRTEVLPGMYLTQVLH